MNDLLVHPATQRQLQAYMKQPGQSITLVGPAGSGKRSLALELAAKLIGVPINKVLDQPYVRLINSVDGKAIGIESIRELEHFLSLKVPNPASIKRIVLIEDAHLLTTEAQNALLKTLEEPPIGTIFIMTSSQEQALLPTIRSRSPRLTVHRPSISQQSTHFGEKYDSAAVKQALLVSGGLPGLTAAILGESEHPLLAATEKARQLLRQTSFERLAMVDVLAKDRALSLDVLFILQQMANVSLQSAQGKAAARWRTVLSASYEAQQLLLQSAQPKLTLTDLMLHL